MRDLLILAILFGGAAYALAKPWIGVLLWTWVSIMNPHKEFGYAAGAYPVAMVIALCTLVGFLIAGKKQNPFMGAPVTWLALFTVWVCITLPFSMYYEPSYSLWLRSIKIYFMIFVSLALLVDRKGLDWFIFVVVASLSFYAVKGGVFTLLSGGSFRVWGPPDSFIEGNNEIAVALIMTIPLMFYLLQQCTKKWQRWAWGIVMVLAVFTVLGTHSRGALIGLVSMAGFMWTKSKRKGLGLAIGLVVGMVAFTFMPEHWWSRMHTIETYEQDESAMGRINAWGMAFNLANDRLFGGGFMIYFGDVFARYAKNATDVHAAHSIYFQIMGEHGWIGLFIFMGIWISMWVYASRLIRMVKGNPDEAWAGQLAAMCQTGLVGYLTGSAFLSLAYFDLPYNMMMMVVLAHTLIQKDRKAKAKAETLEKERAQMAARAAANRPALGAAA